MVWSGSRLANKPLSFDDYAAAGHVVMLPSGGQPSFEDWFMQRYGRSRRIEVTVFSFAAAPHLVVGTDRVATVHARLARHAQRSLSLKLSPVPVPMPKMQLAVQWHKYRTQDPALVWLRDLLRQSVRLMDAQAG